MSNKHRVLYQLVERGDMPTPEECRRLLQLVLEERAARDPYAGEVQVFLACPLCGRVIKVLISTTLEGALMHCTQTLPECDHRHPDTYATWLKHVNDLAVEAAWAGY